MEKTKTGLELISKYFKNLTAHQLEQFAALEGLYKEWNDRINVISRQDIASIYEKHILHSLTIAAFFPFEKGTEILDLGTGGGFPGLPLAIFFPGSNFLLVDSIGKKIKVVESVSGAIGLTNVQAQQIRAEDIRNKKFDFVLSRATVSLRELWAWSEPLIRKSRDQHGLICMKGGDLSREISQCRCSPKIIDIYSLFPESYFQNKYLLHLG